MNLILEAYYKTGLISEICGKVCKDRDLADDLCSEVIMIMMDKPDELIEKLNKERTLLSYIYKVARFQMSKTGPFYRKYIEYQKVTYGKEI